MEFQRYAIFYTPAPGKMADFGAAWLGWDPVRGQDVAQLPIEGVDVVEVTGAARKYGFHGTMKPPFSLAEGQSEEALRQAFVAFCEGEAPVGTEALELVRLGRFLALQPEKPSAALKALAANVVREFDRFRAPMSEAEKERRRARKLSPAQEEMLQRWGYPYVMEEARFHMTLTGRMPRAQGMKVMQMLKPRVAPICEGRFQVDGLSLMGEDAAGRFHLIERRCFRGVAG
jgi:putative phosphonate metabolism protein